MGEGERTARTFSPDTRHPNQEPSPASRVSTPNQVKSPESGIRFTDGVLKSDRLCFGSGCDVSVPATGGFRTAGLGAGCGRGCGGGSLRRTSCHSWSSLTVRGQRRVETQTSRRQRWPWFLSGGSDGEPSGETCG